MYIVWNVYVTDPNRFYLKHTCIVQVLKSYQSNKTVLLIVQIYINLGLFFFTPVRVMFLCE